MNLNNQINELDIIYNKHQPLRCKILISQKNRPKNLTGINGIHLIFKLLERSNDLLDYEGGLLLKEYINKIS